MDTKTLEYMGARVDKAREIQENIEQINYRINFLASGPISGLTMHDQRGHMSFIDGNAEIQELLTQALNNRRDQLQAELDEL